MSKDIKRNDPCHCGSGAKFKNCHDKVSKKPLPWSLWGIILVLIVGFSLIPDKSNVKSRKKFTPTPYIAGNANKGKTEGKANAGKLWSEAHGHWHDANGNHILSENKLSNKVGEDPPGKVWSEEHGHWHGQK